MIMARLWQECRANIKDLEFFEKEVKHVNICAVQDEFPDDYCVPMHNASTWRNVTPEMVEWQIRTFCYTCGRCDRRCRVNLHEDEPSSKLPI